MASSLASARMAYTLDWVQFVGGAGEDEIQSLVLAPWKGSGTESTLKLYAAGWTTSNTLPPSDRVLRKAAGICSSAGSII